METVESADGTTIAFDRSGEGPALVLVVGAFCDRRTTVSLAGVLGADFTVYAYDRRGRGDSGDTAPYTPDREVEDLEAVIGAAGGTARVFGHSSGAVLALEAAARRAGITKLAVYEPPYIVEGTRDPLPEKFAERVAALVAAGRRGEAVEAFQTYAVGLPGALIENMKASPFWPSLEALAHTLPYDLTLCDGGRLPEGRMAAIDLPTLALDGGDSPAWARQAVAAVARSVPDAKHVTLAGQTHAAADDVLAPVLVEFLA